MDWKWDRIKDYVECRMSKTRFKHVLGVVETAEMLAERHDVNVDDAKLSALAHDVAKEQPLKQTAACLRLVGEENYLKYSEKVWHAPMGAIVAEKVFGIENKDILNAIKYHTTGRSEMTKLEKVIFVADYTELNRTFESCIRIREFWDDLDKAVYEILKQKLDKVTVLGSSLHPDTLEAYEYYKKLVAD